MPHHLRHRWLNPGENVLWHAMANRGPDNTRQVGGILYLTDQRLLFEPNVIERFTDERPWEIPVRQAEMTLGRGLWEPHLPVLRDIALRFHLRVKAPDGATEDFFVTHAGEPLERLARWEDGTQSDDRSPSQQPR